MARGGLEDIRHFKGTHVHAGGDLIHAGFAAVLLFEGFERAAHLVDRPHAVEGETHHTGLFCQCLQDRLTNPPDSVGDELEASGFIETLGSLDETEIAFADQILEGQSLALVFLGDADDKAQIGLDELVQSFFVTLANTPGQCDLFFRGKGRESANLLQILFNRLLGPGFGWFFLFLFGH
ncbi:MAG: hypothetical protein BWY77_01604 [bacterium ADurb.Bin431]|nr:MAG: hypothetical protein BWY77_01604 [bacterium ADurb.Bin431]